MVWWILVSLIVGIIFVTTIEISTNNFLLWLAKQNISKDPELREKNIPDDKWWSPVRFKPLEGNILFIMRGNPKGPLYKVFHSVTGWELKDTGDLCKIKGTPSDKKETLLEQLGLVKVGFFKATYTREIKYNSYETVGNRQELVAKIRSGQDFYFQTNIAVQIEGAEDKGNLPLNALATATMRIINPRKAEFMAGKPEVQAMSAMISSSREFIGINHFVDLRGKIIPILPTDLEEDFGIELFAFRLEKIDPADPDSDYAKVTRLNELERLKADATEQTARGIRTLADAEAARIATVYAAKKGSETLALAEAIEKFEGGTLVLGNVPGTAVPLVNTGPSGSSSSTPNP